jgi:hypothetical protein
VLPVLADGAVVATLRAGTWRESAAVRVGEQGWVFGRRGRELTARRDGDPEGTARLHARQTSWWRGTWALDLDGLAVTGTPTSLWRGHHRFTAGERQVAASGSTGGLAPLPTLTTDGALPLPHVVFLLWLELVLRRRAATAAGVAAAGGAAAAGSG